MCGLRFLVRSGPEMAQAAWKYVEIPGVRELVNRQLGTVPVCGDKRHGRFTKRQKQ